MKSFRLTQCYHCLGFDHIKTNCPRASQPRLCAKCGENNHTTLDCGNTPCCLHCNGPHPATARCCPFYLTTQQDKYKVLEDAIINRHASQSTNAIESTPIAEPSGVPEAWVSLSASVTAAVASASKPEDFLYTLYTLLKDEPIPSKTLRQSYNADLAFDDEQHGSVSEGTIQNEENENDEDSLDLSQISVINNIPLAASSTTDSILPSYLIPTDDGDPISNATVLAYNAEDKYEVAPISESHNFREKGLSLKPLIQHHPVHCPQPKELHPTIAYNQNWHVFLIYDTADLLDGGESGPTSWIFKDTRILLEDHHIKLLNKDQPEILLKCYRWNTPESRHNSIENSMYIYNYFQFLLSKL